MSLNYKEYITKENIEKFSNRSVSEIKFFETYVYVKFNKIFEGSSLEFNIDDYGFKDVNSFSDEDYSKKWQKFMLRSLPAKLRDKYIDDFNKHLDSLRITWEDIDYNEQQFSHQHKGV